MTTPSPPNIDGYTFVRLVAGADTQPAHLGLNNVVIALPSGTDIGSGPTAPGRIMGVYGYPRTAPAGSPVALDWVMSSSLPAVAKGYIAAIPDTGWLSPQHEHTYRDYARALVERGIPMADIGQLLTALHNASVANERIANERRS